LSIGLRSADRELARDVRSYRQVMSDAEGGLKVIELARAAGLSIRTVRYYDQIGLLTPPSVQPGRSPALRHAMLAHLDLLDHQQAIGAALRRQLVVSSALLGELERVLGYPKIATRISPHEARELLDVLRLQAGIIVDPRQWSSPATPTCWASPIRSRSTPPRPSWRCWPRPDPHRGAQHSPTRPRRAHV